MKKIFFLFFLFSFFLSVQVLQAQTQLLKRANDAYEQFEFARAIDLYQKVLTKDKKNGEALEKLAHSYRLTNNINKMPFAYKKAIRYNKNKPELQLYYGLALMSREKYEEALLVFQEYIKLVPDDSRGWSFIAACQNIDQYKENEEGYELSLLPINSESSDFGPTFFNGGLVFASGRTENVLERKSDWTGESFVDMYYTSIEDKGWTVPAKLDGKTDIAAHEGPGVFNEYGTIMYFTRNTKKSKAKKVGSAHLKIFKAKWKDNKWVNSEALNFCSDNYSVGHPALAADNKTIYFSSNMPGGFGGKDIYKSEFKKGKWTRPENLGEDVNTEGDEMFPTAHRDGTLYFASNGLGGLGGLDVFMATPLGGKFMVVNAGAPINSSYDDFGLIFSPDPEHSLGYVASNRKGGKGGDDIYMVTKKNAEAATIMAHTSGKQQVNAKDATEIETEAINATPEKEDLAMVTEPIATKPKNKTKTKSKNKKSKTKKDKISNKINNEKPKYKAKIFANKKESLKASQKELAEKQDAVKDDISEIDKFLGYKIDENGNYISLENGKVDKKSKVKTPKNTTTITQPVTETATAIEKGNKALESKLLSRAEEEEKAGIVKYQEEARIEAVNMKRKRRRIEKERILVSSNLELSMMLLIPEYEIPSDLKLVLIGIALDKITKEPIAAATVTLEEIGASTNTEQRFSTQADGNFYFKLESEKRYVLKMLNVENIAEDSKEISTINMHGSEILHAMLEGTNTRLIPQSNRSRSRSRSSGSLYKKGKKIASNKTIKKDDERAYNTFKTYESPERAKPSKKAKTRVKHYIDEPEPTNELSFKVQIGSFKVPSTKTSNFYQKKLGSPVRTELNPTGGTRYITGHFKSFAAAENYRQELIKRGLKDAFVAGYINNHRVELPIAKVIEFYGSK